MLEQANMNTNRMIAGQDIQQKLSKDEMKAMDTAYTKMFHAFTHQNLLNGKTLGAAWHDAIRQMESFVATKDKFNPAAQRMADVIAKHKKEVAKQSMTHKNKDKGIKPTPQQREQLQQRISAEMNAGKDAINKIVAKYQPTAEKARADIAKLNAEKAKQAAAKQAKQPTQPKSDKTAKFADATKQLSAAAMQQLQMHIFAQMQQRQHQRAA